MYAYIINDNQWYSSASINNHRNIVALNYAQNRFIENNRLLLLSN